MLARAQTHNVSFALWHADNGVFLCSLGSIGQRRMAHPCHPKSGYIQPPPPAFSVLCACPTQKKMVPLPPLPRPPPYTHIPTNKTKTGSNRNKKRLQRVSMVTRCYYCHLSITPIKHNKWVSGVERYVCVCVCAGRTGAPAVEKEFV